MTKVGFFSWLCLLLWCTWLFALQGALVALDSFGPWVPDFGLLIVLALGVRAREDRVAWIALVVGVARMAFTTDPVSSVLVGYVAVAWTILFLRDAIELDRPAPRTAFAAVVALALFWFLAATRLVEVRQAGIFAPNAAVPWHAALATAAGALFLVPVLRNLPGLTPFVKSKKGMLA